VSNRLEFLHSQNAAGRHSVKRAHCGLSPPTAPRSDKRIKLAFAAGAKTEFGRVGIIIGGGDETLAGVILNAEII
jgi:hypothetical protein